MWPPLRYAVVIIISTLLLPPCPHNAMYRRCIDACVFVGWRRLASYRVTYQRDIMPSQQYIVAEFPHGVRVSACVIPEAADIGRVESNLVNASHLHA